MDEINALAMMWEGEGLWNWTNSSSVNSRRNSRRTVIRDTRDWMKTTNGWLDGFHGEPKTGTLGHKEIWRNTTPRLHDDKRTEQFRTDVVDMTNPTWGTSDRTHWEGVR